MHKSIRTASAFVAAILLLTGCAIAQNAAPSGAGNAPPSPQQPAAVASGALSSQSSIDQILDALDAVGRDLQAFTADVTLTQTDPVTTESIADAGKVYYQSKGGGDARVLVRFDTQTIGTRRRDNRVEYLLDGGWLVERNQQRKTEIRRQVLRPGEKMNLLKLGEGPFPLPIGQDKAEVHRMFEVSKVEPQKDDPANTVHLLLKPIPGTQFARRFAQIGVWVGLASHMPQRIDTLDNNQTTQRQTDLSNVQVNPLVEAGVFQLPPVPGDWNRHEEPFEQ